MNGYYAYNIAVFLVPKVYDTTMVPEKPTLIVEPAVYIAKDIESAKTQALLDNAVHLDGFDSDEVEAVEI